MAAQILRICLIEEEYICAYYITEIRKDFINNSSFLIPNFYSFFFFRSRSINFKGVPSNPKALRNCFSR